MFSGCTALTGIALPSRIGGVGAARFQGCGALGSITIPSGPSSIGYLIPAGVTNIGNAFQSCGNLTGVTIPASLGAIDSGAFEWCGNLGSVTISNGVTSIGDSAFSYCGNLTSVTIPNSVTNIGGSAFAYCWNLARITAGSGLATIEDSAFYDCMGLTGVYFRGNPPTVGAGVFDGDSNATAYYLPANAGNWNPTWDGLPTQVLSQTRPQIVADASFGVQAGQFTFKITGDAGLTVVVQACTNLVSHDWSSLGTTTLTGGASHFSDAAWTNYPARFYRVCIP